MSELGVENDKILHMGGFDFEQPRTYLRFFVLEQIELVKGVALTIEGDRAPQEFENAWTVFDPKNLLRRYGKPSRVWFVTASESMGDKHGYYLLIAYDDQGIIVRYDGFLTKIGSNFRVCPRFEDGMDIQYMEVYLQAPNDPRPLEEFGGVLVDRQFLFDWSKRIEDASGLSEEQFYELFAQNEEPACFDSPVDIWPEFFTP